MFRQSDRCCALAIYIERGDRMALTRTCTRRKGHTGSHRDYAGREWEPTKLRKPDTALRAIGRIP